MKEVDEIVEICEPMETEASPAKESWIANVKDKVVDGFKRVKNYVAENPETAIYVIYGTFMLGVFGGSMRSLHIANKTAQLDYNLKLIKGIKEM